MADPRAGDVAEAEQLLARTAEGAVALLWLTAAELWVLCGTDQVLADEQEARWWNGLGTQRQQNLATAVLDFLADRELVRPADGEQPAATGQGPAVPMTPVRRGGHGLRLLQRPGTDAGLGPPAGCDLEALSGLLTGLLREGPP